MACLTQLAGHTRETWASEFVARLGGAWTSLGFAATIDTIWRKLRGIAKQLASRGTDARNAVTAALSYIQSRKAKMRYATH